MMQKSNTIVLLHGLFVNDLTWQDWIPYLEAQGFQVHAPAHPGHAGLPAQLRNAPPANLHRVGFKDVVQHTVDLIDRLDEKPLVIGHSMAGMVVQKLVEMDKVSAGVSIAGAPPRNVTAPFSTVRIVWPSINFFAGKALFRGSEKWYRKAFFNTLSPADQQAAFQKFALPESRKIGRDLLTQSFSNVNFKLPHAPLLFVGGTKDAIFPNSLTRKIAGKYQDPNSQTDLKFFEGRSHFICGEPNWEEVADHILHWYRQL